MNDTEQAYRNSERMALDRQWWSRLFQACILIVSSIIHQLTILYPPAKLNRHHRTELTGPAPSRVDLMKSFTVAHLFCMLMVALGDLASHGSMQQAVQTPQ